MIVVKVGHVTTFLSLSLSFFFGEKCGDEIFIYFC
jgi:hypothetical protein